MNTSQQSESAGPLEGLRVVELTHVMAGPTCGLMLADMGADVIKIERPPDGDTQRFDTTEEDNICGEAASFMMVNRNKRGLALDLKSPQGKDVLRRLLKQSDVLVENFRPGTLERLGFGYEALKAQYPRLIYCTLSGFGRTGPYGERGGFDLVAQAMSGLMSITGEGPACPPLKCGAPITDIGCGILAAMGILAAVFRRERTGEGQFVETSLLEAGISMTYWQSALAFASGKTPQALGTAHPLYAPYQAVQTKDGWLALGAANETNWRRLLQVLDLEELANDELFATVSARMAHREELEEVLNEKFRQQSSSHWERTLQEAGIPAGPVLTINEMHRHPQVRAREMVRTVEHSRAGSVQTLGCPVKFSATPTHRWSGAPLLGEHTREILSSLLYTASEIEDLEALGVVRQTQA